MMAAFNYLHSNISAILVLGAIDCLFSLKLRLVLAISDFPLKLGHFE